MKKQTNKNQKKAGSQKNTPAKKTTPKKTSVSKKENENLSEEEYFTIYLGNYLRCLNVVIIGDRRYRMKPDDI